MQTYTQESQWQDKPGYTLTLEHVGWEGEYGNAVVKYCLKHGGKVIFEGCDLHASPLNGPESPELAAACIDLLTYESDAIQRNHETENAYTPQQLAFLSDSLIQCDTSLWSQELQGE